MFAMFANCDVCGDVFNNFKSRDAGNEGESKLLLPYERGTYGLIHGMIHSILLYLLPHIYGDVKLISGHLRGYCNNII